MKKIAWAIGVVILVILIYIGFTAIVTSSIIKSYDTDSTWCLDGDEYYYNSSRFTIKDLEEVSNYFGEARVAVDGLFNKDEGDNLKIVLPYENGISKTYAALDVMVLHYTQIQQSPIVHEYIHESVGVFKEEWFNEGLATFVSLYLKKENKKLRSQIDMGDKWFGILDYDIVAKNQLTEKYTPTAESIALLNLNNTKIKRDQEMRKQFYMASASFIEFLVNKYGIEQIAAISTNANGIIKSAKKEFYKNKINILDEAKEWALNE